MPKKKKKKYFLLWNTTFVPKIPNVSLMFEVELLLVEFIAIRLMTILLREKWLMARYLLAEGNTRW